MNRRQEGCRLLHQTDVERVSHEPRKASQHCRRYAADRIGIASLPCAVAGMKIERNILDPVNHDILREQRIQSSFDFSALEAGAALKVCNLPAGMDARVGPPCSDQTHLFP